MTESPKNLLDALFELFSPFYCYPDHTHTRFTSCDYLMFDDSDIRAGLAFWHHWAQCFLPPPSLVKLLF